MTENFRIEKVLSRTAYARNGNAHSPAKYYVWYVYKNDVFAYRASSLKDEVFY